MLNIRHCGITVDDLEKADFFYRELLGLKYINSKTETDIYIKTLLGLQSLTWVKLKADNGDVLELYWLPQKNEPSFNHVAFTVKNVVSLKNKLEANNIKCSEIQVDKDVEHRIMFCRDYDENLIELVEEI
jgi:catechol 2,3-dioxygenase-like lactoylglutathione lyase family enzyme